MRQILVVLLLLSTLSWAQSAATRVNLRGTVVDAQGLPLPNATVTAKNADFGDVRSAATDSSGNFLLNFLPAGPYMVQAEGSGLAMKKPIRVQLTAGSSQQITLKLSPKAVESTTTVTGRAGTVEGNTVAPAVNKQDPKNTNTIAGLTVTYMPNRNRDFTQFQQLASGAVEDQQGGVSILGQSSSFITASIDGAEFTDALFGGQSGSTRGQFIFPQVAVREFQIVKSGATAEVGGTTAGFINIATKEGANKFRGEAFYIVRPAFFTADDAFGNDLDSVQNEFGGALSGPIKKDKAFFFVGFEQDFLTIPAWTRFAPQPAGSVPAFLGALEQQTKRRSRPTALFARLDFVLPKQSSLNLQGNFARIDSESINGNSSRVIAAPEHRHDESGHSSWLRASLNTVISTTAVNQVLAQWSRETVRSDPSSTAVEDAINGFGLLGGSDERWRYGLNRYQVSEDVSISRGTSSYNFGVSYLGTPLDFSNPEFLNGKRDFSSLADYLGGNVRRYRQGFVLGDVRLRGTVNRVGLYATSRFELTPQLTVSAGLRWEGQWNPERSGTAIPDDLGQWQPRVGLAWNPEQTFVLRASAGLYAAPTPAALYSRLFSENGSDLVVVDSYFDPAILPLVAASPHQLTSFPGGIATRVFSIHPDFNNPRSFQFALTGEKELNKRATFSTGYIGARTWDLPRMIDRNLAPPILTPEGLPVFGARPNPAVGQLLTYESRAHSRYDGWLTTLSVQLPKRSALTANYTLSRTRDDHPLNNPLSEQTLLDPFNPRLDEAFANVDARHAFTLSGVVNLPAGFKCNPLLIARSGQPYTPIVGFDLQNDANDLNDRALIGPTIASRNSFRQPGFLNLDLRFVKDFTLKGEGHHLDLFLDILNVTGASNRNFGPDATGVFGTPASPVFSAGQPLFVPNTSRLGSARQVQFTARVVAF